jgi:hypothetical protein
LLSLPLPYYQFDPEKYWRHIIITDQTTSTAPKANAASFEHVCNLSHFVQPKYYEQLILYAAFSLALLLLIACADIPDHSHLYDVSSKLGWPVQATPDELDNFIQWPDAVDLLMSGQVVQTMQLHNLALYLFLQDGQTFSTIQPDIDTYMIIIYHCGEKCADIVEITE